MGVILDVFNLSGKVPLLIDVLNIVARGELRTHLDDTHTHTHTHAHNQQHLLFALNLNKYYRNFLCLKIAINLKIITQGTPWASVTLPVSSSSTWVLQFYFEINTIAFLVLNTCSVFNTALYLFF